MEVGFTGTHYGLTPIQHDTLRDYFVVNFGPNDRFHSGDCVGSDGIAHTFGLLMGMYLIGHIPDIDTLRAFLSYDEIRRPLPYLVRNKNIVKETKMLLATPATKAEVLRSGTWSTIRYARSLKRKIVIIFPDGSMRIEND